MEGFLDDLRSGKELSREEIFSLKSFIKSLYTTFLNQFRGIVCATLIAATNHRFRTHFGPDLVLIDEGGRAHEHHA